MHVHELTLSFGDMSTSGARGELQETRELLVHAVERLQGLESSASTSSAVITQPQTSSSASARSEAGRSTSGRIQRGLDRARVSPPFLQAKTHKD